MDQSTAQYGDSDLVYVDPDTRKVVGKVQFSKHDRAKSLPYVQSSDESRKGLKRFQRKYYPFGTYKSMRNVYRVDFAGKPEQPERTLDEVLPKALHQAFWND